MSRNAAQGVAVREYRTDIGPADYVLFVDGKPCGVIEAKKATEGYRLSVVEEQSRDYAKARLKYFATNTFCKKISTGSISERLGY